MNDRQRLYLGLSQRRLEKGMAVTISGNGIEMVARALADLGYEVIPQPKPDEWAIYPKPKGTP